MVTNILDLLTWLRKKRIAVPSLVLLVLCCVPFLLDIEKSYIFNFLFFVFIYTAMTQDVVAGVKRHVARAQTFPRVARAIESGEYGFTVLVMGTPRIARDLTDPGEIGAEEVR